MATILVIDGDVATQIAIRTLLQDVGHEVLFASEGMEGLAMVGLHGPDIVLTELYLDGMEGMEFLRRVRMVAPSIPVLVISDHARSGATTILRMATMLGAVGLLDKPVDQHQLIETVEEFGAA